MSVINGHDNIHRQRDRPLPRSRYVAITRAPFFTTHSDKSSHRFGRNNDIDTTTVPEDVWQVGGAYPWPTTAQVVSVVSTNANDDVGGTGAREIAIQGLDENWEHITEYVDVTGLTPVVTETKFIRVSRIICHTAGSLQTNAGVVTASHGATTLADMQPGEGTSLMALYTVPANHFGEILSWNVGVEGKTAAELIVVLQMRHNHLEDPDHAGQGAWQTLDRALVTELKPGGHEFVIPAFLEPRTDVRVRVLTTDTSNMSIEADLDVFIYTPI